MQYEQRAFFKDDERRTIRPPPHINPRIYHTKYNIVVISGGSMRVISTLGAMQYLYTLGCFDTTSQYIGTSAGAIVSLLLAIGMSPLLILKHFSALKVTSFSESQPLLQTAGNLINRFGMYTTHLLKKSICCILEERGVSPSITFNELYTTFNKCLIVVSYNFTKRQCEYLSRDTHPELSCVDALCMSSCIPIYFMPFEYNACLYIDGGMYDNFPIIFAEKRATELGLKCIGFNAQNLYLRPDNKCDNIVDYMYALIGIMAHSDCVQTFNNHDLVDVINIPQFKESTGILEEPANTSVIKVAAVTMDDVVKYTNAFIYGFNTLKSDKEKLD